MDDLLGYRRMLGLVTPASNTVAIADACRITLTGVTAHQSDFLDSDNNLANSVEVERLRDALSRMERKKPIEVGLFVDEDLIGDEDVAVGGLSRLLGRADLISPHTAILAAIACYGTAAKIAVVSPFPRDQHARAIERLQQLGLAVVSDESTFETDLRAVARTRYDTMRLLGERALNGGGDLLLQLGHNLPMARQVDNLEEDFAKPVLAINTVCFWHMLRRGGIHDPVPGHGMLLMDN